MTDKNDINNEAEKKKSVFLHLTDIIGNEPHWQFPLNKERLDELLNSDFSKEEVNDFKAIFWATIQKMKESGIQFFSPGGSYGRQFIYWFNSHFWAEDFKQPTFEKEDFLFKEALKLVKKYCKIPLTLPEYLIAEPKTNELLVLGGNALSKSGKEFLFSLYPVSLLAFKKFV
ncbi:MAG: hypothetical protein H0W75_01035 [Chitinophagaceae bacterium]|nr:hypothetical protein [Chitinophagaceae bacterium]